MKNTIWVKAIQTEVMEPVSIEKGEIVILETDVKFPALVFFADCCHRTVYFDKPGKWKNTLKKILKDPNAVLPLIDDSEVLGGMIKATENSTLGINLFGKDFIWESGKLIPGKIPNFWKDCNFNKR
jgi:hypothetical protein